MLLFVDNNESQTFEINRFCKKRVGADDDVDLACGKALLGPLGLGSRHQA